MRCCLVLSALAVTLAVEPTQKEQGQCLVDSGEALSDAMDASLFIWAAYKRCGLAGQETKCEIDVSSSVKATDSMVNIILKVLDKCHDLNTANKACGLAASKFTEHAAGLAATAGQVYQKCPTLAAKHAPGLGAIATPVMCTIDIKNSAKGLFKVIKSSQKNKHACAEKGLNCDKNILDITASVAGMGQFVAGAVGACRRTAQFGGNATTDTRISQCNGAAAGLLEYLMEVSKDGIELAQKCGSPAGEPVEEADTVIIEQQQRLYSDSEQPADGGNSMSLMLGALLPITAVVSFVGGRRYSSRRIQDEQLREFMSDSEALVQ